MGELSALGRLAFDELARATGGIGGMHEAIAARAFGRSRGSARAVHDVVAGSVYGAIRAGFGLAGVGAARGLERFRQPVSETPRGAVAIAALNGLVGDELERTGSPLAVEMTLRAGGRVVAPSELRGRVVVFLHGLMETELAWRHGDGEGYGELLRRELGATPVWLRYNTGRRVSENGRSLSELLSQAGDVDEIALVGHSMGGLVARSACHVGALDGAEWVRRVRHVVSLGTPHTGAPLERAVHVATAALGAVPETRMFAGFLRRRSGGIRDLRQGSLVDEDWRDRDPDALRVAACAEVPLLEGATHCFVSATLTRSATHPLGRLLGDALVLVPSAAGRSRTRRIPFRDEDGLHVGGAHHLALLNHPAVGAQLVEWLDG